MAEEDDETEKFYKEFRAYLSEVDEVVPVTLKGHLEVERHLDNVLRINCFYPQYFEKLGLSAGVFAPTRCARLAAHSRPEFAAERDRPRWKEPREQDREASADIVRVFCGRVSRGG
jgi:hypothetical protein